DLLGGLWRTRHCAAGGAWIAAMRRPQSLQYFSSIGAPCVLASRRPAALRRSGPLRQALLENLEPAQAFGLLARDLDVVDARTTRALAAELDEALDGVRFSLEHGFDRAVPVVADPACDAPALCAPPDRVSE